MCIHIESELAKELKYWRGRGLQNVSGVSIYNKSGYFLGSWLCFADQPQSIAQAVQALKTWHPDWAGVDLSMVNDWRFFRSLPDVKLSSLPHPLPFIAEGVTDEDTPEQTRRIVAKWLDDARAAAYERA